MRGMPQSVWTGLRVLVTGPTGLLGSWLIKDLLSAGATVTALMYDADPHSELIRSRDHERVNAVEGCLENLSLLERTVKEEQIEVVFHLGAQTIVTEAQRYPLKTFEANIRGTYNLLEACRVNGTAVKGIVVASSDKAYGESSALPYTESMPLAGRQPYELSKSCADLIAQGYYHSFRLPVAVARCGNIFGGGDLNPSRIVPGTIVSCLEGKRPVIRSDGSYVRDYIYVKDAAAGYRLAAEHLIAPQLRSIAGEAYNFGPEKPLSVLDIVNAILTQMNCRHLEPEILNNVSGEIHSQYLDSTKAREQLGWAPKYSLESGLAETIEWYRAVVA